MRNNGGKGDDGATSGHDEKYVTSRPAGTDTGVAGVSSLPAARRRRRFQPSAPRRIPGETGSPPAEKAP